jgi:DNA (cytosine-5)-methyltransferase 1
MLTLGEFCAGTGGFSTAFSNYATVIYSNDIEPSSKVIYDLNFSHKLTLQDVHLVKDVPRVDIVTCGFSCQPFSISGNRLGFDDERSNVFFAVINHIKTMQPRCILFENVKNLITHDNGNSLKRVLKSVEELGYFWKWDLLNTCKHTQVPQNRERIYIVCFKDKSQADNFKFPEQTEGVKPLEFYLEKDVDSKYYYDGRFKIWNDIKDKITQKNIVYQYRRGIVRENKSGVVPTLTATCGTGGHNVPLIKDEKGIRKLTPRECFNLQGFSSSYKLPSELSDSKLYKLAGNAITVTLVERIAKEIFSTLYKPE